MEVPDITTKAYMNKNAMFADAFNFLIYGGEEIIRAEELVELDAAQILHPLYRKSYSVKNEGRVKKHKREGMYRYMDVLKSVVIKHDGKTAYVAIGIEKQSDIYYAMPVRNMIYDALQYEKQVTDILEEKAGIHREYRLMPVVTLVVHFGPDKWTAPLSLHDMFGETEEKILDYVQNYKIHIIDPASLAPEEIEKFKTGFGDVMGYIKYSNDKDMLLEFVKNEAHKYMDTDSVRVINEITDTPIKIKEGEKVINMCKAIEELMNDSRQAGMELGMEKGIVLGRSEGITIGMINALTTLVNDGIVSVEEAAKRADMSREEFIEKSNLFS